MSALFARGHYGALCCFCSWEFGHFVASVPQDGLAQAHGFEVVEAAAEEAFADGAEA